jgi:hypothetical protein
MSWNNHDAIHRHASHAYEDFRELRKRPWDRELWHHSMSHHVRHVVHRSGLEVDQPRRRPGVVLKASAILEEPKP